MLNKASHIVVRPILDEFFKRWPCEHELRTSHESELKLLLEPLGLRERRAKLLVGITAGWMKGDPVYTLPGVGDYALDSYVIFCRGHLISGVTDKKLLSYLEWAVPYTRERECVNIRET